jgi:hypothetical protein
MRNVYKILKNDPERQYVMAIIFYFASIFSPVILSYEDNRIRVQIAAIQPPGKNSPLGAAPAIQGRSGGGSPVQKRGFQPPG